MQTAFQWKHLYQRNGSGSATGINKCNCLLDFIYQVLALSSVVRHALAMFTWLQCQLFVRKHFFLLHLLLISHFILFILLFMLSNTVALLIINSCELWIVCLYLWMYLRILQLLVFAFGISSIRALRLRYLFIYFFFCSFEAFSFWRMIEMLVHCIVYRSILDLERMKDFRKLNISMLSVSIGNGLDILVVINFGFFSEKFLLLPKQKCCTFISNSNQPKSCYKPQGMTTS